MKSQARIFCGDFPKKRVIKNNRVVKRQSENFSFLKDQIWRSFYALYILHKIQDRFFTSETKCIKRNAKVVNFETDKQKSMNELKKIIRLFKLTSRSKEKCAQTLLESEQYDV